MTELRVPAAGGAFDEHRPPAPDLLADCVRCGFCLPTCPTYVLWGEEMDSPRGRINLMEQGLGGVPMTDAMVGHWDACLGCMACVTSCPSGVQYDRLIEATRAQVERRHRRSLGERVLRAFLFAWLPRPARLRAVRPLLRAYQALRLDRLVRRTRLVERLSPRLAALGRLTPRLGRAGRLPERMPAVAPRRAVVGMLTGCVQRELFPGVNAATARVLQAEGCDVIIPRRQGCCGALSLHSGREAEAQRFARETVDTFEAAGVDVVVASSAGCGSAMKGYAHLLADDPDYAERAAALAASVRDVAEYVAELGPVAPRHRLDVTVAYHDACHLSHAQGVRGQPRQLLAGVPGLTLREIPDPEVCCGSAGIYNVLHPEPAGELGARKAQAVASTGAEVVASGNPGCLLQLATSLRESGRELAVVHTVEVLDASVRGVALGPASAGVTR